VHAKYKNALPNITGPKLSPTILMTGHEMYAARFHASGKDTPYVIAAAARYIHTKAMVAPIVAAMISAPPFVFFSTH
jgi:hypothetical protein